MEQMTTLRDLVDQVIQKKEEEKRIAEEQAAKDRSWKIPICYDDDEDNTIAITPFYRIEEPDNSLKHSETIVDYNDDSTSSDDDSYENIEYVDASPPYVEIVSLEVVEIVDPEVGRIDDDILLTIKDDILREKLLNVNLLIAKIDSLRDNPTPSSEVVIKSTSTFPDLFLEETNTFDNSIPESETFSFNLEEISSGRVVGIPTRVDFFSQYDNLLTLILANDQFPPADRSIHIMRKFADELDTQNHVLHLELECFKFKIESDPGDLDSIDLGIRKNASTTNVNVPLKDETIFSHIIPRLLNVCMDLLCFSRQYLVVTLHIFSPPIFSPPGMKIPFFCPALKVSFFYAGCTQSEVVTFNEIQWFISKPLECSPRDLPSTCFPMDQ
ncbi:hypothetical protein Tco_0261538 [Tanacetum coccineum]